jgi:transcription antitermination factor NusG
MPKTRRQNRSSFARAAARPFVPRFVPRPRVEIDRGLAWYCVHTRSRAERHAESDLRRAGFATYLPTEAYSVVRRGRVIEVERAPVTRYLFVGLDPVAPEFRAVDDALTGLTHDWWPVLGSVGSLIRVGEQPLRIGAGALQTFADNCTGSSLAAVAGGRCGFRAGETARIVDGAFSGLSMRVEDVLRNERVLGLVDLLGGRVVVEATADQLEAA